MFIVNVNALRTVNGLNLFKNVVLNALNARYAENILRIYRTGIEHGTGFNLFAALDFELCIEGKRVFLFNLSRYRVAHNNVLEVVAVVDGNNARNFAKGRAALGFARFEKFFYAGKTLGDVARSCYTAGMEGTHGKLGTGLAYGLSRDDAYRLAHLYGGVGSHVLAVALCAYAVTRVAAEYRADGYLLYACIHNLLCDCIGNEFVLTYDYVAVFILDVFGNKSALNSVFKTFDNFAVGSDYGLYYHAAGLLAASHAVFFAYDNVLRNVYETAGKVARVCRFKRGIGKTFTSAVRRNEVFKNGKTLSEARLNGYFYLFTLRVNHQSAHAGKLFHLVD